MSREDLLKQFAHAGKEEKILLLIIPPYFFYPGPVEGNSLTEVTAYDKDNKPVVIPLTYHTGVRIIKTDSSRVTFYFNTLELNDSTITGSKTHFFEWRIKPIQLKDVARIQIQK